MENQLLWLTKMLDASLDQLAKEGQQNKASKMRLANKPYFVEVLTQKIIVLPHVFYPEIDTELLIKTVTIEKSERLLEPFAGTGTISIFLAHKAKEIIATDINPHAVKNVNENIRLHKLESSVKAIQADIFPRNGGKFDVIVANPPYTDNVAKNIEEKSMWDVNHEVVKQFLREARGYLNTNGRIYCSWANFADFGLFENLIKTSGYSFRIVGEVSKKWQVYRVYELKTL
jgi:release factor glutamine methyltransferase